MISTIRSVRCSVLTFFPLLQIAELIPKMASRQPGYVNPNAPKEERPGGGTNKKKKKGK